MLKFNVLDLYEGFANMGLDDNTRVEITYPDTFAKDNDLWKKRMYTLLPKKITVVILKDLPSVELFTDVDKIKINNIHIRRATSDDKRYGINSDFIIGINMIEKW